METQSPYEVSNIIEGQDEFLCLNMMPSQKDREIACERLRKDKRITSHQIRYLAGGENGIKIKEMVVVSSGENAKLIKNIQHPKNQNWKPELGTFEQEWKKRINDWVETPAILEKIEKEYEDAKIENFRKTTPPEDL